MCLLFEEEEREKLKKDKQKYMLLNNANTY